MAKKKGKAKAKGKTKAAAKKKLKPQNPDNPARLITPPFRVAFPHVFQPNPRNSEKQDTWDICMLFPKDTNMDHIQAAIDHITEEKHKGKTRGFKMPIRDGDKDEAFDDYQESHEGMLVLSARTIFKPGLVDNNLEDIIDPGDFYSGCWARASITAFSYDNSGNKGVSFSLNNLQKLKDDEPFTAAGMKAAGEFADAEDSGMEEDDTEEGEEEEQYDVDEDGFAIDEDGEWIVDEDDNYLNADGVPVDEDCEPLEDEEDEEDDESEEEDEEEYEDDESEEEEDEEDEEEDEEDDEDW